ncbi:MAG: bifunctional ADP-dependent NAD(P)H-hydrate dehydratase/NAD(P)H-hydrate epimerase [Porticoccaceae bacterium]|nr:bifunctional ADP-dependent NAD(P)H-hydrate dehydratase/NAD(P)H-hydrate epimerase [Porticoccaceae bacterium]
MQLLPQSLYTAEQVRELDRLAIEEKGIPGIVLMKRAGQATLRALLERWPAPPRITVYCGAGNNGGDGYIVAGLAAEQGIAVHLVQVADAAKLSGDARKAYDYARQANVPMYPWGSAEAPDQGVIVDALLGTGISGEVRADFATAIGQICDSGLPVVSVDIPSGLSSNTGAVQGCAVKADLTVTFIGVKRGLLTGRGPAFAGDLHFDSLGVPADIYSAVTGGIRRLEWNELRRALAPRPADAHKGLYGHVMIIGGELGFGGAVMMAAEAALASGAGLVSVATRPEHVPAVLARCPEVMAVGVTSGQSLEPWLDRPSHLVLGPGLGRTPWSEQMVQKAVSSGLPVVVDADALNIIAEGRVAAQSDTRRWLVTPHPGEAARLLGVSASEVQRDRFAALEALSGRFHGSVVLKGAGTLVSSGSGSGPGLCAYGNPGMAVGGMGDVLSGVLGGLLAQGLAMESAAELGVCAHALAGDDAAAQSGQIGLRATDLIAPLRHRLNAL